MLILGLILGFFVGFVPAMIGGGGSVLSLPIFLYVMGYSVKTATVMSLISVGVTSFLASIKYVINYEVNIKIAFIFGTSAMISAYIVAKNSKNLDSDVQLFFFALMMAIASYFMLINRSENAKQKTSLLFLLFSGLIVGIIAGVTGVGGGFIIVPTLVLFANLPIKQAVGTSLVIMTMNAGAATMGYFTYIDISWPVLFSFIGFGIIGIWAGARCSSYVSQQQLKKIFAYFLMTMSILVFFQCGYNFFR